MFERCLLVDIHHAVIGRKDDFDLSTNRSRVHTCRYQLKLHEHFVTVMPPCLLFFSRSSASSANPIDRFSTDFAALPQVRPDGSCRVVHHVPNPCVMS